MDDRDSLIQFEKHADTLFSKLEILNFPLRSVFSYFCILAGQKTGYMHRTPTTIQTPSNVTTILTWASYVIPHLDKCSLEIEGNINDALAPINHQAFEQIVNALCYGRFCEIMPAVRNNYLDVEANETGFSLRNPSESFEKAEERDIVLGELTLPFNVEHQNTLEPYFDRIIHDWPKVRKSEVDTLLGDSYDHYSNSFWEPALLTESAYEAGLGFSRAEFQRVRAVLMSWADFCLGMASAAERRKFSGLPNQQQHWDRENNEWLAPTHRRSLILEIVSNFSGIAMSKVEKIFDYLTLDTMIGGFSDFGDGYFPPFIRIADMLIYSPHGLKHMLPERNLLYIANKRHRENFDSNVSSFLEPALIEQAKMILEEIPGVDLRINLHWKDGAEKGEIDLLAFQSCNNVAIHFQAKATMAPQGARMTRHVESRTRSALEQLAKFDDRPSSFRDRFCSQHFGCDLTQLTWVSAILSRSSMGTAHVYSESQEIAYTNLAILKGFSDRLIANPSLSLADLVEITNHIIDDIVSTSVLGWKTEEISLFGVQIDRPILDLNVDALTSARLKLLS